MNFRLVTESELDRVRNLESSAAGIRRKIQVVVEGLAREFNGAEPGGICGMEFASVDSPRIVGTVATPFGEGRLRLVWEFSGVDLRGNVVLDRALFNELDLKTWEPVFSISFAESGGWGPNQPDRDPPRYMHGYANEKNRALGASILFAIINGAVI